MRKLTTTEKLIAYNIVKTVGYLYIANKIYASKEYKNGGILRKGLIYVGTAGCSTYILNRIDDKILSSIID